MGPDCATITLISLFPEKVWVTNLHRCWFEQFGVTYSPPRSYLKVSKSSSVWAAARNTCRSSQQGINLSHTHTHTAHAHTSSEVKLNIFTHTFCTFSSHFRCMTPHIRIPVSTHFAIQKCFFKKTFLIIYVTLHIRCDQTEAQKTRRCRHQVSSQLSWPHAVFVIMFCHRRLMKNSDVQEFGSNL